MENDSRLLPPLSTRRSKDAKMEIVISTKAAEMGRRLFIRFTATSAGLAVSEVVVRSARERGKDVELVMERLAEEKDCWRSCPEMSQVDSRKDGGRVGRWRKLSLVEAL